MSTSPDAGSKIAMRKLLEDYGQNKNLGPHAMENALRLASGSSKLVVLMQEPCNAADTMPYKLLVSPTRSRGETKKFKSWSPALQEVEDTIYATSNGRIGLQDISLIDVNMLCPLSFQKRSDFSDNDLEEAQKLCLEIVKLVKPKVVLVLTCVARHSAIRGTRVFSSSLLEAGKMERKSVGTGYDCHSFSVIKGFHPSIFLRKDYTDRRQWGHAQIWCARRMFHMCFRKAILELWDEEHCERHGELQRMWKRQCH